MGKIVFWLALACTGAMYAQNSESFGGNIVLGRPTDRSITVNAQFTSDQDAVFLDYGTAAGTYSGKTGVKNAIKTNVPFQDVISGLSADTLYYYRVNSMAAGKTVFSQSAEHTFRTQRAKGSSFTFTLVSDSHLPVQGHCNPARYALTLQNAREDNPDFHIDLGDTFYSDNIGGPGAASKLTYDQVVQRVISHRPYFGILTHSAPLFLANGNHDGEYLFYTKPASNINASLPVWETNARLSQIPTPVADSFYSGDTTMHPEINGGQRQSYYAWEWGDALFVVLDPYWEMVDQNGDTWNPIHGDPQYLWFRDTLRKSKAKYKFVFEHHLLGQLRGGVEVAPDYEWGGQTRGPGQTFAQARPGWDKPIHQLMVENGVTVYFQGHDHLFARAALDGVTYVTVPMPGAGPPGSSDYFSGNPNGGWFSGYGSSTSLPSSGHVRVSVAPAGVKVEYVAVKLPKLDTGTNKEVVYSFTAAAANPPKLAIVSSASYQEIAVAPGSIATAFGSGLPASGATVQVKDSAGMERAAQVLSSASTQVSFVVPDGTASGAATVTVSGAAVGAVVGTTQIAALTPAIFAANANSAGVAAAVAVLAKADGTQVVEPVFNCPRAGGCAPAPLDMGTAADQLILSLYGTGIRNRAALSDVLVFIGDDKCDVLYAGPQGTFAGLDQINVRVPRTRIGGGAVSVILSVAGKSANVTMASFK